MNMYVIYIYLCICTYVSAYIQIEIEEIRNRWGIDRRDGRGGRDGRNRLETSGIESLGIERNGEE